MNYSDARTTLNNISQIRDYLARVLSGRNPDSTAFTIGSAQGSDEVVNTVTAAGASQTIPAPMTASINYLTLTAASCALTFPAAAAGRSFSLVLKQDATGSRAVTWPSIKWASGDVEPTLTATAGKEDWFTFACVDGANWDGFVVGQNV
jgi:hypothetical protein